MEYARLLSDAITIGEKMLCSGAEVSRVEDSIVRICSAYGASRVDVFTITSSIVVSADFDGKTYTQTRRIKSYRTDLDMLDRLKRDNLRICLDTGHAAIFEGAAVADAVRRIGPMLEAVHIHDNMGKEDEHLIPGDGIIDWDDFAKALKEIGFDKVISIESSPKHGQYPRERWAEREANLVSIAKSIAKKAF